jgi:hypothetical protein
MKRKWLNIDKVTECLAEFLCGLVDFWIINH